MNDVYSNARDRVGKAIHDYVVEQIEPGDTMPGIDWHDSRDIDAIAEAALGAVWGTQGASANMPLIHAQFTTGADRGITGFQSVDVLKVEANDDGSLMVTLNYWPKPEVDLIQRASTRLALNWEQKKAEMVAAWLDHFKHNPADVVLHSSVEKGDVHGEMVMVQRFWIEPKPHLPDFEALGDKRMSEMTAAEQDDAKEGWLRKNVRYFDQPVGGADPTNHIEFLLARIDQLRGVK